MVRLEFKLNMPHVNTWNGDWSGKDKNYIIVKTFSDKKFLNEIKHKPWLIKDRSWNYSWDDGWGACVSMRVMKKGEKRKQTDGFCGYEWMVDSIIEANQILDTDDIKEWRKRKNK